MISVHILLLGAVLGELVVLGEWELIVALLAYRPLPDTRHRLPYVAVGLEYMLSWADGFTQGVLSVSQSECIHIAPADELAVYCSVISMSDSNGCSAYLPFTPLIHGN